MNKKSLALEESFLFMFPVYFNNIKGNCITIRVMDKSHDKYYSMLNGI